MRTACTKDCPDACSLLLTESENGLSIRGNPEHPITQGLTCAKIHSHLRRLQSKKRIRTPLRKTKAGWQEISWDQALKICAEQIQRVLDKDPCRMLHIRDAGARGVSKETTAWFFRSLGLSITHGSLCDQAGIQGLIQDYGSLRHNDIRDLSNASWIVNWGKDISASSTHLAALVHKARKNGTQLVSICPGGRSYAAFSERIITLIPGRDRFLALAVAQVLQESGRLKPERLRQCQGLKEYLRFLDRFSLAELQEQTGVGSEDIQFLADIYARDSVSSLIGWGVQRHVFGGETIRWINALAWLSGQTGQPGSSVYFNISSNHLLDFSWMKTNSNRSLSLPLIGREIEQAEPGIDLAWINCSNIVNQAPDSRHLAEVFSSLDWLVVVDAFLTDTAACADLILPPALMWEEEDLLGSCMHHGLQYAAQVLSPPPGARSDLWIATELNARLGHPVHLPSRERCFENSIQPYVPDLDLNTIKAQGFVWIEQEPLAYSGQTDHPDGRFRLITQISPEPPADPAFPLRLLSLVNKHFIHSQILPAEHVLPPRVEVHPRASGVPDLDWNERICLVSPLGRLEVDLVLDNSLHPGVLVYRRGDWMRLGGGVNQLIEPRLTDIGNGAAFYQQQVRLENLKKDE